MDDSNPVVFTVTSQPLPTSWLDQDVGTLGAAGSSSYAKGVFTVKGAGELGGTADAMHFVYQPLSGNGTIVARVLSLQGSNAEAGVMIRQSLSPSDMMAEADTSSSDVFFRYRATVGATAQGTDTASRLPYWVQVVRSGNTFSGFMSSDGVNWVQVGTTETINMTQNAYIGLAVATASATTLGTATFDNVSINSTSVPAPVITSLSATTGPVGSQVQINGSGFGFSQSGGQVMLNDTPMTVNSWTNISITITIATGATSGPLVVSVPPAMNDSNPVIFTVTAQPLPSTWLDEDVGSVGLAGNSSYVNGVFTVQGAGSGTFSTADGMHFVYQPLSGNGTIIARVLSAQGGSEPQAGVMIRETLSPGATMASTTYRLGYGYFVDRPTTGATTSSATINPVALPYWVEVVRSGNSFSGYMSLDGVNWQQVGTTETITMAQNVYVGLAVSSDSTASLATATFDSVSINSAATPAPVITNVSATSGPVGSQVAIFGSGFGATQGTSLVTVNDVAATINSWGATAITIVIPSGATSGPLVVSLGPSMNSSNPVPFTVTSNPIPSGWLDQDIGEVGQAGSASFASGVFTVQGAGTLFGTADSFHFVYQPLSGNGTIIARVATLSGSSSPKAGVMIRETLGSSATFAATAYTASYGYFYWRTTTGGSSTYNDRSAAALPYWVEVVRNGSTFSSYISPDGVNWSQVATSETISMAQNVYIGLVVSDSPSVLATATFDNVSVSSSTTLPTPVITAISPNAALPFSTVTITGTNFQPTQGSSTISFNGTTANATAWSSTSISTSVPSGATSGNIVVTVNGLPSNGINFAVLAQPTISGISPSFAGRGAQVTITGTNFGATQGNSTVTFNGSPATTYVSWSPTQIVAAVPSNATTGPVIVTVTSLSSVTTNPSLTVVNPVLSSISPTAAGPGGSITLNGSGFGLYSPAAVVTFNGVPAASSAIINDGLVTATVPSNATTGPLIITVEGVASNSLPFTMVEALSITGISPAVGPPGDSVTITGVGFGPSQSTSVVAFYGTTATVSSWSDTQIVAIVPADALPGPVSVEVAGITINGPNFTVNSTIQLTDSLGNQSNYTSALAGGMWHVTQSQGSGCSSCSQRGNIQSQYDSSGNLILKSDELGHTTSYTYDSSSDMTSMSQQTSAGGTARTSYTYNSFGEVLTVTDALGNVTTNTYDSHGNLLTVTTPAPNSSTAGSITQFAYNSLGELTQITDPLSRITKLTYTSAGLIYTITDPQQNVTTYQYDSRGNRTSITDAMNNTTSFAYDSGNRLLTITYPGGTTTTSFTYDYRGRRITMTDQNSRTTTYSYDDADRLVTVTDPATNKTQYSYDTENNLLSIEDANSHTTSFTYDAFGRVTETSFPSTHYEQYAYDAANNLISKTDRKGQTINYVYDDMNRLTQKTYPDSTSVEYVYDLVGKLRQVTDPTGTYGFAYDNMGRLVGTSTQYTFLPLNNFTNSYTYDANSNRLTLTDPQGGVTSYAYDTLNRLSTLTPPTAFSSTGFGFTYDVLSRRTQMTRPNGVTTNYTYDNLSRLLSVLHQVSASTIDGAAYTYDSVGNRTSKTNELSAVASNYTYDPLYELTQVTQATNTTESYLYDPVGNRLSSLSVPSYTNNSSNELTSSSAASYAYDANGNMSSKTVTGNTTQYTWDYENRLISVLLPGTGGTAVFKYDGLDRRVQKAFTQGSTTTTNNYLYDGVNSLEDVDQNGNVLARYEQTTNVDEPLAELRSGVTSYYQADGLGSVTSLSSSAGALANTYTYDSFGNFTSSTGSLTNRFQFTGRELDSETGIYYYRSRYYDPAAGRFASEDPSETSGGSNLYEYVVNNPANLYDPTGLQGTKPKPAKLSPNAVFYLCCQGGVLHVCDLNSSAFSGWVLDCMRSHENKHVKDLCAGGKNPCKGKPDGKLLVPTSTADQLECAAYRLELDCLIPAPMTKEIQDRRHYIQTQIKSYCGGN
jgi:RHS repeat-associated protein